MPRPRDQCLICGDKVPVEPAAMVVEALAPSTQHTMRVVSFDTETHLIKQGLIMPRMVCLTWSERTTSSDSPIYRGEGEIESQALGGFERGLALRERGIGLARKWLIDDGVILVGHNIVFDLGVLVASDPSLIGLVFDKLRKGLARDTQTRMQMIDIATGELKFHYDEDTGEMLRSQYHLADLSLRLLKKWLKKEDTWRLKYALLDGVPLSQWPEDAKKYAIDDAVTTLQCYEAQDVIAGVGDSCDGIPNSDEQHRAQWALHLMSAYGLRTDPTMVAALKAELEKDFAAAMNRLKPSGLLNVTPARALKSGPRKGQVEPESISKFMKAIKERVVACYESTGRVVPLSDSGANVSTSRKTLVESGDPQLKELAEAGVIGKLLNTYVPVLEAGARGPINPRYNVLVETGRTSCAKPNIQNPPRKGGVRECFVPRPGWVFAFSDYDTLELRSLAQVCLDVLGRSEMAEALRRGEDLHLALAAEMLGITLEEAQRRQKAGDSEVLEYRQQAKPANFGFPGGMAAESFREYAEGYGIALTSEQAKEIHDTWFRKWPEMRPYFDWISSLTDRGGPIQQIRSNRVRGGATYCAAANGFFQGLAADGAKEALWAVAVECYTVPTSPLFGCRPVLFLHDEIGMEIPRKWMGAERASAAAKRLSAVMIEAMIKWIPDIPISCKPIMCRRWYKGAEQVISDGCVVPCRPEKIKDATTGKSKTKWVADLDEVDGPVRVAA